MIRPLRSAHRWIFAGLLVALPALLLSAIGSRKPNPAAPAALASGEYVDEFRFLLNGERTSLSLNRMSGAPRNVFVLRAKLLATALPETLLYWTPLETNNAVPADAVLIGAVAVDRPFEVPVRGTSFGFLLLYDGPHQRILARLPLGKP